MKTRVVGSISLVLLVASVGCSKPANNVKRDVGVDPDMASSADTGVDADEEELDAADTADSDATVDVGGDDSECLQVTAGDDFRDAYADDVSIEYDVTLSPQIDDEDRKLTLLFERYGPAEYVGTFELGVGPDANFGTCAHCVFIRSDTPERAWFVDRGTLVSNTDPFDRRVDIAVTNLRLVEVAVELETRTSAPIPDGRCIEVADFSTEGAHPPSSWLCEDDKYDDGAACHCGCGEFDPDCSTINDCLPGEPGCPSEDPELLPIEGCETGDVCAFDPVASAPACATPCDWRGRQGCDDGTCVYDGGVGEGDLCITQPERLAPDVRIGEACPQSFYALACNVVDGFAEGYCGPNGICRGLCETNADCQEPGHTCRPVSWDQTLGYCGPEPSDG